MFSTLEDINTDVRSVIRHRDQNKPSRNLLKMEVFYQEFNYERIHETPAYAVLKQLLILNEICFYKTRHTILEWGHVFLVRLLSGPDMYDVVNV